MSNNHELMVIAGVVRVEVVTEEETPQTFVFDEVAEEVQVSAIVSEGKEEEKRVRDRIVAQIVREDIIKGYDITINNAYASTALMALIDGGTWDSETKTYEGPEAGSVTKRTKFTLNVYSESLDYNGDVINYLKFTYKHCLGKPMEQEMPGDDFMENQYRFTSRPRFGEKPVSMGVLTELPSLP